MATAIPKGTSKELEEKARSLVQNDPAGLAPKFRDITDEVLAALNALGIDAVSHECIRSDELAAIYHELSVSKAVDANHTWHKWGLARDIISKSRGWDVYPERKADGSLVGGDPTWYTHVFEAFMEAGLHIGANFHSIFDAPHVQWGGMPDAPTDALIAFGEKEGLSALWLKVGAA
jgi:hypothetical protein